MSLAPLFNDGWIVTSHALIAMLALVLGAWQLLASKGGARHRLVGYAWTTMMVFVAASSFWIHSIRMVGLFSPIHILSVLVLVNAPLAVHYARKGNIRLHKAYMKSLFFLGLVVTGAFTLLPGRAMHAVVFGQ